MIHRPLLRMLLLLAVGAIAAGAGVGLALVRTAAGRGLLARLVAQQLNAFARGTVAIGTITGSFSRDLVLTDVEVRDTAGALVLRAPRVAVRYRLGNLLGGRIVLDRLAVDRPAISLDRRRAGRWNFEEVFHLGESRGGGRPALIVFRDVEVRDGALRLAYPWPGASTPAPERAARVAAARAKGGMVEERPEGTWRVLAVSSLTARLARLAISSPDRKPLRIEVDSLHADLSDPAVRLRDLRGVLEYARDSLRFDLARAALPGTVARAEGVVSWPADTVLYDFRAVADTAALADLRFVSPLFPDMRGAARLAARWETGTRTRYEVRDLRLADGEERLAGELTAVVDAARGLGVRGLRLTLERLDLDKVRGYLDTLPFDGRLSGPVEAEGWLDALRARGDWTFEDAAVAGAPTSRFAFDGGFRAGGAAGLVFDSVRLREADVALATVRRLAPAVLLAGRLRADGIVDGPLRDATFLGTAEHRDADRPVSRATGRLRLDTRAETLALDADLALDPLDFEGIRREFPALAARGSVRGRAALTGTLVALAVDLRLAGEIGDVAARGTVTLAPPRWGADALAVAFRRLDLAALAGRGVATALDGQLEASGAIDSAAPPAGRLAVRLDRGTIDRIPVDSLRAVVVARDSLLALDSLRGAVGGVRLSGGGALGWRHPQAGRLRLEAIADSLRLLDAELTRYAGAARDTTAPPRPLNGRASLVVDLFGALDSLLAGGQLLVDGVTWRDARVPRLELRGGWQGGARPWLSLGLTSDSVAWSGLVYRGIDGAVSGPVDSLAWSARVELGPGTRLAARGRLEGADSARTLALDSLALRMPRRTWQLAERALLALGEPAPTLTPLALESSDGGGRITVAGQVPWAAPGALAIEALGVDLGGLYALGQLDTAGIGGTLSLRLDVGGTRRAPTMLGSLTLEDVRIGDARGPLFLAAMRYGDRRLEARGELWRTGTAAMRVDAELPLDLALAPVEERRVPGPLRVRGTADQVDLALLEPLTRTFRDATGTLDADVRLEGTWAAPQLAGTLTLTGGAFTLPALNERYRDIALEVALAGDSLQIRRGGLASGNGRLDVTGTVRLLDLTHPVLDLTVRARRFRAINRPELLTLTATGELALRGPLAAPTVTGRATADEGVLWFADLLSKRVIDLEDPANSEFLDTTLLRERRLSLGLVERLTRDVVARDVDVAIGSDFWLRSNEANIKLEGDVRVNKSRAGYRVDGTLQAVRGKYTLSVGPVSRDFDVTRGNVRYFGTPDLNAELDIEARHLVRTNRNQELPIVAQIGGSLLNPRLSLRSEGALAALSQTDLVAYLLTGTSASEASVAGTVNAQGLANVLLSATTSELERTLISDLGLPLDMLEFRPSVSQGGGQFQLLAGVQLGRKTFLTFNAGFCPSEVGRFDSRNLGASLEYRFSREFRAQLSAEPAVRLCGATGAAFNISGTQRYQLGADILWQKEF